jgi:cysteine-rich repeat protein
VALGRSTSARRAARVRWATVLAATALVVLAAAPSRATHFRYGHLTWQVVTGNTVEFTLQNVFRRSDTPSFNPCVNPATNTVIACTGGGGLPAPGDIIREDIGDTRLNFGDGSPTVGSPGNGGLFYVVTSVDPVNNWAFGLALDTARLPAIDTTIQHTYPPGTYTARIDDCCRISPEVAPNAHLNNPDLDYRVETRVAVGTGNSSPVSALPPIVICTQNSVCSFLVPASDPDGDTLTFRLSTAPEADTGAFVQPGPPQAANSASINPTSGVYTWDTTGATLGPVALNTLYSTQVTIEERDAQNNVKGKVAVDFFIQLVPHVNEPPEFTGPPQCNTNTPIVVDANTPVSFPVSATDPDAGDLITLNAAGLPLGATMTPGLPTTGLSPVSSTFAWTPTLAQAGDYVVTFSATDDENQQDLCAVTLRVRNNCGDGDLDPGEQCDDGNTEGGDCCAPDCRYEPPTTPCQGTNPCNQTYTCNATGTCVGTNQVSCQPLDQCHLAGVCDTQTGLCTNPAKPDGTPCDDGDLCLIGDVCTAGVCGGASVGDADGDGIPDNCDDDDGPLNVTKLKMRTIGTTGRGRVSVKGDFLTHPPEDTFTAVPGGLRIRIRDGRETDIIVDTFTCALTTSGTTRCDVKTPRLRIRIKPIPKTNGAEYRFTFKFESSVLVVPIDNPIEVTMTQLTDGVDRIGSIADCLSKPNGAICNEP